MISALPDVDIATARSRACHSCRSSNVTIGSSAMLAASALVTAAAADLFTVHNAAPLSGRKGSGRKGSSRRARSHPQSIRCGICASCWRCRR